MPTIREVLDRLEKDMVKEFEAHNGKYGYDFHIDGDFSELVESDPSVVRAELNYHFNKWQSSMGAVDEKRRIVNLVNVCLMLYNQLPGASSQ